MRDQREGGSGSLNRSHLKKLEDSSKSSEDDLTKRQSIQDGDEEMFDAAHFSKMIV